MRTLRIKRPYFEAIVSGAKTLEIRVGYNSIKSISSGDLLLLQCGNASQVLVVKDIRVYGSFPKMLSSEPLVQIMPGVNDTTFALRTLQKIYPSDKERLGVYVIEIEKR